MEFRDAIKNTAYDVHYWVLSLLFAASAEQDWKE